MPILWVLKDLDGNQWSLKHRVDIKTIVEMSQGEMAPHRPSPLSIAHFGILAMHPDGNVVHLQHLHKLFAYHLNHARLEAMSVMVDIMHLCSLGFAIGVD